MSDADRISRVRAKMASIHVIVTGPHFEQVHSGRWRYPETGQELETGYVHGEGTVRVFKEDSREPINTYVVAGAVGELAGLMATFPPLRLLAT